jgi:hypothetical protein
VLCFLNLVSICHLFEILTVVSSLTLCGLVGSFQRFEVKTASILRTWYLPTNSHCVTTHDHVNCQFFWICWFLCVYDDHKGFSLFRPVDSGSSLQQCRQHNAKKITELWRRRGVLPRGLSCSVVWCVKMENDNSGI